MDGETVFCRAPSSVVPFQHFSLFPGPQLTVVHLNEGLASQGLPQSCTCTTAVAYWGPATAGGGGAQRPKELECKGGGNRRHEGGIPQIGHKHRITLMARKGTAPPTMATFAITSAATAGATTATPTTREGEGHCYLLNTD